MGWSRPAVVGLFATVVLTAACSGCGGSAGEGEDETSTTTTETTLETGGETGYRFSGTLDYLGVDGEIEGVVVDPETYALTVVGGETIDEERRVGDVVYTRFGGVVGEADELLWTELDAETGTAVGSLVDVAAAGGPGGTEGLTGTDVAGEALTEILLTDPGQLVDLDAIDATETRLEPAVPEPIAEALDELGVDDPELELTVVVEEKQLVAAEMEVSSPGSQLDIEVEYRDHGEVDPDEVVAPAADEIDPTPWVDEQGLAAFDDTELVVPAAAPTGLALLGAHVLPAGMTLEGCPQVALDYDAPPGEEPGDRFVTIFLLSKACATSFDPTPFDQVLGGHPSRFDGYEVLVGNTVVQLATSEAMLGELDALAASLQPTTADALVASVVPPE
jgi:hypothetical protein